MISMRGRRRVGKSRLAQELIRRSGCPSVFYTAAQGPGPRELERLIEAIASSDASAGGDVRRGATALTWEAALELAVSGATRRTPVILVIDELPYLVQKEPAIEALLQLVWDRTFQRLPVLVLLIGSDRATMSALVDEGRPLYDRAKELVVRPLDPATIGRMLGLAPADALDAYTVIGGFPVLALEWGRGRTLAEYLNEALYDSSSFLVVSAERALAAEFPADLRARAVLSAIGADARAHKTIQTRSGLSQTALDRSLKLLVEKGVVERVVPYSTVTSPKTREYLIADPYMRFWLSFVGPNIEEIDRGRGELVAQAALESWPTFRGRAIEPTIRAAIERMLPDERFGGAKHAGSYWNRVHTVQVDLVGGDHRPVARRIGFVGSIKWRERRSFDRADTAALATHRAQVPGADAHTRLVGVARAGFARNSGLDVTLSAKDIVAAWPAYAA
jgi:AAA+ ATPase superfamily predicted ATPase